MRDIAFLLVAEAVFIIAIVLWAKRHAKQVAKQDERGK